MKLPPWAIKAAKLIYLEAEFEDGNPSQHLPWLDAWLYTGIGANALNEIETNARIITGARPYGYKW